MGKRYRIWFAMLALVGVALAVYFEPTHCVRGWLRGEAFFDGRPSAFWRQAIRDDLGDLGPPHSALWARFQNSIGLKHERGSTKQLLFTRRGDKVLRDLVDDSDPGVAMIARHYLSISGMGTEEENELLRRSEWPIVFGTKK